MLRLQDLFVEVMLWGLIQNRLIPRVKPLGWRLRLRLCLCLQVVGVCQESPQLEVLRLKVLALAFQRAVSLLRRHTLLFMHLDLPFKLHNHPRHLSIPGNGLLLALLVLPEGFPQL